MRCLILLGSLLLYTLASHAQSLPADGEPDVNVRQLLQVGMIDFAPYSYLDAAGQPAGSYISIISKIAEHAGYQTEFRVLPIARLVHGMQDGTVHLWPGIAGKPELSEHTWVSRHILGYLTINLYYRQGTPEPLWPQSLRNESVILLSGYDYSPTLLAVLASPGFNIRVQRTHSHEGAIGMLERNRARFLLNYGTPMRQALRQRPDLSLDYKTLRRIPLRMIVSRQSSMGSQTLMDKLDRSYQQLIDQGEDLALPEF